MGRCRCTGCKRYRLPFDCYKARAAGKRAKTQAVRKGRSRQKRLYWWRDKAFGRNFSRAGCGVFDD